MGEKDQQDQSVAPEADDEPTSKGKTAQKPGKSGRENRLAEALRANLRRRKSAAKSRKDS